MADNLVDVLESLTQRTGSAFDLTSGEARTRFLIALRTDIASIMRQLNGVYLPLVENLVQLDTLDALTEGLAATSLYTDPSADASSANAYYDSGLQRPRTIKETFDVILADIAIVQNGLSAITGEST